MHASYRDARYWYPNPESFWPERWLIAEAHPRAVRLAGTDGIKRFAVTEDNADPTDEFRHNPAMFLPFANGQTNCVGRALALIELRCTVAMLVRKFVLRAGSELDLQNWESQLEDYHVMKFGDVLVLLEKR